METACSLMVIFLCTIAVCMSQESLTNPYRGERYKTATFDSIEGKAAKSIIKTTYVSDRLDCMLACLRHPSCQSYNYQKTGIPKHVCELSDTAVVSSPLCQDSKPGFIFSYPIPSDVPLMDCSTQGCNNGGTCVFGCKGYVCNCLPFNTGKYCEHWSTEILSCKDILNKASYTQNRAYLITMGNKPINIYCHLSNDLSCGGGGWTLAMKIDGTKSTFGFSAALWSNKEVYNLTAGQTGFDNYQTKMPGYWSMSFSKLCVGFKVNNVLKWIVIPYSGSSLYDVIADGAFRQLNSISKNTWISLLSGASLQPNCNQRGFNLGSNYARLGIRSNQENNCDSCDSCLGFGLNRHSPTCGNYCGSTYCSAGHKTITAFGYIMIQ